MITKSKGKKAGKKGRVKTLKLKRETIRDLTRGERKKVKGGGGKGGLSGDVSPERQKL